ncbi:MAG: hypothetical protein A2X25_04860 [Chloroflexi bacterium GWB2_49_20]|nr:MAG: hypothetical protein A2X25_04860 [Chloroflexi bacterium GWB2_49_20]OGN80516.1 MAG: hypothetical protein A2X26_11970 [Chloroflexi bacterium GWC2_49_37]OGN83351.1 MAG: hypothetical protein A2X27_12145 [Chloroflexi bacterium GWD2_49_16]HCC78159.1 hypothetical protein [Anaerolineae bacterium]
MTKIKETIKHFITFIRMIGNVASVHELQERMLNAQLVTASLVSVFLYFFALIPALQNRLVALAILYTIIYVWLLLITFFRRLPYWFRTESWLFFLLILGVINLYISGLNVDAGLFLLTFVAMTSLLLDIRIALLSLMTSALAIAITGLIVVSQNVDLKVDLPQTDPLVWIIGGLIFMLLGTLSLLSISSIMRDLLGKIERTTKLAEDLSQAHDKLSESEIRFRSLIEYSTDLVAILHEDGEIGYTSPSIFRLLGYKPEDVTGRNVLGYIHTEDQAIVIAALTPGVPADVIGTTVEVRVSHQNGLWRWFEVNGFELKTNPVINGTVVNCRDITDRKNVESLLQAAKDNLEQQVVERTAELQSASARLKELVLHSPAVIYSTSLDGGWKSVQASDNVNRLLGYTADQIKSEIGFWNFHIHPEDTSRVTTHKARIELEKRISCKYRLLHRDGNYRWIRDDMQLVLAEDGQPLELIGSWIDITNQVEAERSTLSSQDRYRGLYESMMDAFMRVDMSGKIIEFNQAYINMLGYLPEELYQLTYIDLTPPKWHAMEAEIINKQVNPLGFSDVYEKEYIRKDGSIFSVDLRTSLTRDGNGKPESMWAIVRDISHRKQNEAILLNTKQELEKRVTERTSELVASQERLRSLTRQIITTQEDERRSVARELHDEAGQVFITLKHSLDIALEETPEDHPALKARLAFAMQIADVSMQLMRDLSHRLRPPALEVGGINICLEDLCLDISGQTNLHIQYQGEDLPGLPNEIAISLYRVVQESLTNILKHAAASNVQVKLRYLKNKILLSVRDDGKGVMDTNPVGTGLLGLQERLRLLEGNIQVKAHPGKGVHLKATVPWQKEAGHGK